ncbi:alpha/beta fold hydrolase [Streptomyces sp. NPDC058221]|uniref:alpha/beta fold hydrolase n=1 Tax=Streptomyces sp. NPDC058221 TaxID=3346388 RepID=UPI0036E673F1
MARIIRKTVITTLTLAVVGAGVLACTDGPLREPLLSLRDSAKKHTGEEAFSGTKKIDVDGHSVNVTCSGSRADGKPVVMVMAGLGDGLDKTAAFRKTLSEKDRVCSYDRLGEGESDKPAGVQSIAAGGKILTGVLDEVADDAPVVLAGHSLGGLLAARYAPEHQDRVKGLVLMDATSPTNSGDIEKVIPKSATGKTAELRAGTVAAGEGQNQEKLAFPDGEVRSAGDIPVEVIQHGTKYLGQFPVYGDGLEKVWSAGQHKWTAVSNRSKLSTAAKSAHYIYLDRADLAVKAVRSVSAQVAQ